MGESAPSSTLIGRTVGNYEVVSKLGEGGMGAVYLARHPRIGKQVALKVLHSEFSSDPSIVDRFFTEAKSVNDIQHPNIVDIIDYGELPGADGKPMVYFIMEFLEGQSVAELVASKVHVEPERAFFICSQIADALAASHRNMVVHRDLKPDNVFLVQRPHQRDFVKVLDFGIAKLTGDQPGSRRTRTGVVIGTPYYMSPEQCEGKGNVDHRTDVYALGVVLFELLTGRVPFEGEGYGEILVQHLTQLPPRPASLRPGMSPYVELVCLKALEKKRDTRYQTMEEFQAALVDPINFVEQRGGLHGFLSGGGNMRLASQPADPPGYMQAGFDPRLTPVPAGTPAPIGGAHMAAAPTPSPLAGGVPRTTPFPQLHVPTPTPPPAYADELDARPPKSKLPLLVVGGVVVAGIGLALAFALGGGGSKSAAAEPEAGVETASAKPPAEPPAETVHQPPPATPEKVALTIESTPPDADVYFDGEAEPRGRTPYTFEVDKSEQAFTVVVQKEGFEPRKQELTPDHTAVLNVDLKAVEQAASDEPKTGRSRRDKTSKTKKTSTQKKRSKVGDDIMVPDL